MQDLAEGSSGPHVDDLQQALEGLGFLAEGLDSLAKADGAGQYGPHTRDAVNLFRESYRWRPDGEAGQNTRCALRRQVAALQRKLLALGHYCGTGHGRFDAETREALSAFQGRHRLKPTGRVDDETRQALAQTPPFTFDEVLDHELGAVLQGRSELSQPAGITASKAAHPLTRAQEARLMGLAFSGGGIRSATFNLGVLQALAELRLLNHFDYLSTVSGGGYIGGWLHAWVSRTPGGIAEVEKRLTPGPGAGSHEPPEVSWLRQYSNYLTPRTGPFSTDTMAGVATWLRNVLLNQTMLAALALALLCIPWLALAWLGSAGGFPHASALDDGVLLGCLAISAAMVLVGRETALAVTGPVATANRGESCPAPDQPRLWAVWAIVGLLLTGSFVLGIWLAWPDTGAAGGLLTLGTATFYGLVSLYALPFSLGWGLATWGQGRWLARLGPVLAAVGGCLLLAIPLGYLFGAMTAPAGDPAALRLHRVTFGPPTLLLSLLTVATLHLGLSGRAMRETSREWWSRLGGLLLRYALLWLALSGIALYASYGVLYAGEWIAAAGGVVWVITTVVGVIAGRSPSTGQSDSAGWLEWVSRIAPYIFLVGLLVAVSFGLHAALTHFGVESPGPQKGVCQPQASPAADLPSYQLSIEQKHPAVASAPAGSLVGALSPLRLGPDCKLERYAARLDAALASSTYFWAWPLGLIALAVLLGWRVDINVFSFHMFYRNRLERCYLGASRREPGRHPFHGIDPQDSPRLAALGKRPYPLINSALNITGLGNLAWQERKAGSFLFTPQHCGYQLSEPGQREVAAYQKTQDHLADTDGWMAVGTPMTVSGAAASPNAGYHTSPATAFLMTVFNVRLGWWIQNTRFTGVWRQGGPRMALKYLSRELIASATEGSNFVYVSDGGHFENLGIYELVRRRCRYIVACDAGCDPQYTFEDLGNAIRKCGTDLGIEIELDTHAIAPSAETGCSLFHCAVGTIHYERIERDPAAAPGYLLYLKASLTGNEPTDVQQYKAQHPAFPHESTGDQWFGESQFESYRRLGRHALLEVMRRAREDATAGPDGFDREMLFHRLAEQWYAPSRRVQASFSRHGEEVARLFGQIREDSRLRFLDGQIYPEWSHMTGHLVVPPPTKEVSLLPETESELRAGFYFCNELIQLMENVYLDLNLEEDHGHPDNRGWMNIFRHLSWAGMFRVTWAVSAATFGARFQQFCRRHLDLDVGEIQPGKPVSQRGLTGSKLNPVEKRKIRAIIGALKEHAPKAAEGRPPPRQRLRVVPLELWVHDARGASDPFVYHFGVALIREALGDETDTELLYYRVQDHLRRVGLGRRGLVELRQEYPTARVEVPPEIRAIIDAEDKKGAEKLQRLWHSVLAASEASPGERV